MMEQDLPSFTVVARVHWVHPRAEKKMGRNLQEKVVSATPSLSKSEIFMTFLVGGGDLDGRSG